MAKYIEIIGGRQGVKGDMPKVSEDIAPQSRAILQPDVCIVGVTNLPPTIQTFVKFRDFAKIQKQESPKGDF